MQLNNSPELDEYLDSRDYKELIRFKSRISVLDNFGRIRVQRILRRTYWNADRIIKKGIEFGVLLQVNETQAKFNLNFKGVANG